MSRHPSQATIEAYVVGILADDAACAFEAHVEACEACAAQLAAEARFELAMDLVAQGVGAGVGAVPVVERPRVRRSGFDHAPAEPETYRPRLVRRQFGTGAAISGALAMAAVMLLFVGRASSETALEPSVSPAPMVSLDGDITVRPAEVIDGG
jgi:anti-sigma factor RsiW